MPKTYWYFKLFNSLKEEHEIDFAELELTSLFGPVKRVTNFADLLQESLYRNFTTKTRVQDYLAHELPYGLCQGFYAERDNIMDVKILARRLGYTREIFIVTEEKDPQVCVEQFFPSGTIDKNLQVFHENGYCLVRIITNQYFLEKSQYISKLSRNEKEVDNNIDSLFTFLTNKLYRIPATSTMQVGKRLEDYFTIREEPSLYLSHYMHPYKGRFHPKMVRALLNYIYPCEQGLVADNFAGCGTLLVEATWMGLNNLGVEINPLSVLMAKVKCETLSIQPEQLKNDLTNYLCKLQDALANSEKKENLSTFVFPQACCPANINEEILKIPPKLLASFGKDIIRDFIIAKWLIKQCEDEIIKDFLLLTLSGTISDLDRRRKAKFIEVFSERVHDLYLRIYTFNKLNNVLKIELGKSRALLGDTRDMKSLLPDETIDGIVNSPPYSTALDYIKNDFSQLSILEIANISQLKSDMIGNPNLSAYSISLLKEMTHSNKEFTRLPEEAQNIILALIKCEREKDAIRSYKFFKDMTLALSEMYRVMKKGSKCAIIIGNNNYKMDGSYQEVKNDKILEKIGLSLGFTKNKVIRRELEKSRTGNIRYESIVILQKM